MGSNERTRIGGANVAKPEGGEVTRGEISDARCCRSQRRSCLGSTTLVLVVAIRGNRLRLKIRQRPNNRARLDDLFQITDRVLHVLPIDPVDAVPSLLGAHKEGIVGQSAVERSQIRHLCVKEQIA